MRNKDSMAATIVNLYGRKNWTIDMAEKTVMSIMILNKLFIPDVLIDLIKDYLYIDTKTVLRNFYKASINMSISSLTVNSWDMIDVWGRVRQTQWMIGHMYGGREVQLQNIICVVCGEGTERHLNMDQCCVMEGDGEDGTLDLLEIPGHDEWEDEEEEEEDW